jgi:hypothetical protein
MVGTSTSILNLFSENDLKNSVSIVVEFSKTLNNLAGKLGDGQLSSSLLHYHENRQAEKMMSRPSIQ